ncbi:UNVERIFIED_CONTAM: hypothetical protein Sangu_2811800 [Sesamum angustifolium]|uniref:Uncharacterized protein n=1 Tax=Sesamum angustifolium TaxID=2727405 RepID=A0AAW2IRH3_9LAMI
MVIPGPSNPKRLIDVYLQPLIDELLQLWHVGVRTHDHATNQAFMMCAALMWTVNDDLPAYGMASGWSAACIMGCPICIDDTSAFHLQHDQKACYFDCHRRFLPQDHPYWRNKKAFIKNRQERNIARPRLTGEEIPVLVEEYSSAIKQSLIHPPGYGTDHKWTKKSIFWDLSYWTTHLIRHNLDVMHIEKNAFDNIFNTVMDIKGKSKDNLNAQKDLAIICNRTELQVDEHRLNVMPKAVYTLTKDQKRKVLLLSIFEGMTRGTHRRGAVGCWGCGKLVRPLAPDASDAAEASRQPLPTPPVAPAADEPPQSPLIDPTSLDQFRVPSGTSTVGGSFALSSIPSSVSQAPTTPRETHKFITLAETRDFGPLHAAMEKLQTDPQSEKNFWFEELKRVYWWDCPDTLMQNIFNSYATSWLSKTFAEARVAGTQPKLVGGRHLA